MLDLEPYLARSAVLPIAVSGGADSMALLLMAHEWARPHGSRAIALTVDHGLRPEAAEEAKQVHAWCTHHGIEQHTLNLRHAGFALTGTSEEARDARYRVLSAWCMAHGMSCLLTAHHRGDQAETLFFRLARGSHLRGLACIQPVSQRYGITLIRPLLGMSKKNLMAYLRERGQPWIEDPSNRSVQYTRNRIRAQLQALPDANGIEARAADVAAAFGRFREKIDAAARAALAATLCEADDAASALDAAGFAALPRELGLLVLAALIQQLTGNDHPPRTQKLERLYGWLLAPDSREATLAHLQFRHAPEKNRFYVFRSHPSP